MLKKWFSKDAAAPARSDVAAEGLLDERECASFAPCHSAEGDETQLLASNDIQPDQEKPASATLSEPTISPTASKSGPGCFLLRFLMTQISSRHALTNLSGRPIAEHTSDQV